MGPDQPPMKATGTESVRSVGGLWTMGEGRGEMPDGKPAVTVMTLGYDPPIKAFRRHVHRFDDDAHVDLQRYARCQRQSADARYGRPGLLRRPGLVPYQDIIEFVTDDHRTLKSRLRDKDGNWNHFMEAHYRRK